MTYNLADLFESVVDTVPEREALVTPQCRLSFQELDKRANRLAHALTAKGIGKDDKIGLQLRNCNEFIEAMLAAFKIRAVPININYNYVAEELEYIYDNADLVALICHQEFSPDSNLAAQNSHELKTLIWVTDDSGVEQPDTWLEYGDLLANSSPNRNFETRSNDDLYMVYTGGTTGKPKGVMWRHEDIFFAAMGGGDPDRSKGPISQPDELPGRLFEFEVGALPTPPFIHAAAQWLAMNQLLAGAKIIIPAGTHFSAVETLHTASKEKVMLIVIVGDAMAQPLVSELESNPQDYDLSSLFVIASGGALFSPSVKKKLLQLLPGRIILDGLGASETGTMGNKIMQDSTTGDDETEFIVNENMTVLDKNLQPVTPGSGLTGQLAKTGHLPIGYYKALEKTRQTFVEANGKRWALPGDLATVEADGSIRLLGRSSTCINTGGEKVFPEEVESTLKEHPSITDALVVGLTDKRLGQRVVAIYQTDPDTTLSTGEIREFCRGHLANYKLPQDAIAASAIQRTAAGKPDYQWAMDIAKQQLS